MGSNCGDALTWPNSTCFDELIKVDVELTYASMDRNMTSEISLCTYSSLFAKEMLYTDSHKNFDRGYTGSMGRIGSTEVKISS